MAIVKKLVTREEKERKRKRNYILIAIIVVFLMVLSPAGYTMLRDNSSDKTNNNIVNYNGIKFIKDANGYWQFQSNGMNFITRYNPNEINDTKSSVFLTLNNYREKVLSFEWNETQGGYVELANNLFYANQIPLRIVHRVCLHENCSGDIPTKSCSEDNVISFRVPALNEKERVYREDNCVFIIANETNQVKYADAFLFNILGV